MNDVVRGEVLLCISSRWHFWILHLLLISMLMSKTERFSYSQSLDKNSVARRHSAFCPSLHSPIETDCKINYMSAQVSRWISVIGGTTLLVLGTIGALFNIVLFRHRTLRSCPYSSYMFTAAFFDLITLDHALLLRILSDGFGLDPIALHSVYCCLRFYTGQIASFVPITLICLAAIDRWAVSGESTFLMSKTKLIVLDSLRRLVDHLVFVTGVRLDWQNSPSSSPFWFGQFYQYRIY